MCVCVCLRERESVCVFERERESVCVCLSVLVCIILYSDTDFYLHCVSARQLPTEEFTSHVGSTVNLHRQASKQEHGKKRSCCGGGSRALMSNSASKWQSSQVS